MTPKINIFLILILIIIIILVIVYLVVVNDEPTVGIKTPYELLEVDEPTVGIKTPYELFEVDENKKDVDIVITWVDSSDKKWIESKNIYIDSNTYNKDDKNRFPDVKYPAFELETTVLLIIKHIKWFDTIFIVVADGQKPSFDYPFIKLVNHSEIWPKDMLHTLPTFNSHAIEANLHRIPGLKEKFIYFNDDMYLCNDISKKDVFLDNKIIVQPMDKRPYNTNIDSPPYFQVWNRMMILYQPINILWHGFYTMNITIMKESEKSVKEDWNQTIASRFRSNTNLAPIGYSTNYALKNNMGYLTRKPLKLLLFYDKNTIFEYPKDKEYDIICINESSDVFKSVNNLRVNVL